MAWKCYIFAWQLGFGVELQALRIKSDIAVCVAGVGFRVTGQKAVDGTWALTGHEKGAEYQ